MVTLDGQNFPVDLRFSRASTTKLVSHFLHQFVFHNCFMSGNDIGEKRNDQFRVAKHVTVSSAGARSSSSRSFCLPFVCESHNARMIGQLCQRDTMRQASGRALLWTRIARNASLQGLEGNHV